MLNVYDFGEALITSGDLDPVYIALHRAELEPLKLRQWLLAYWCFYHMGTSSWIVDQPEYWTAMRTAAGSKDWPRSSERRHFRGKAASASVEWLAHRGISELFGGFKGLTTAAEVTRYVRTWTGFGPWIAFKVADMIERLGIAPVAFDGSDELLFESPRKGAEELQRQESGTGPAVAWAMRRIGDRLGHLQAPPRMERTINAQEIETVLCKWHSYLGGHYEVGKDIREIRHGLLRFARCRTAQMLLKGGKRGGLWR